MGCIPKNKHPQGAAAMTQHKDKLGRTITVDSIVAFTWSMGTGVHVGRVIKLTAKKVRIEYINRYEHGGEIRTYRGRHITDGTNTLLLNGIEQELTIAA